ncbi:MAG: VanW family protein [Patescibacteria group bacterium]|jgi:vancomycin resistance protein YoaR
MTAKKLDTTTIKAIATWGGVTLGVLGLFSMAVAAGAISYGRLHDGKIFPGVRVLNVRLDGLTRDEARETVQKRIDEVLSTGIAYTFHGKQTDLDMTVAAADGSESRELIQYDIGQAINKAFDVGRTKNPIRNALVQLGARINPLRVPADVVIDEKGIEEALREGFGDTLTPARDASFDIRFATGTTPLVRIQNEEMGADFRMERAMNELKRQAERLTFMPIELEEQRAEPRFRRADLEPLEQEVIELLNRPSLTFTYQTKTFPITTSTLARLITVVEEDGKAKLTLSRDAFHEYIKERAPDIEQETKNGDLDVQDGKIISFTAGTQGIQIDAEKTLAVLETAWPKERTFPLLVTITSGSLLGEDPEALGIKEIIGIGRSNFSGSPSNRRKNIAKGAQKVNGTIIEPGGEFSLLKTLGSIDGANGWLPELVIKGNETKPEFGGGLCQIGTTVFRGALSSGLDITERRNHSYRVRYYEPAGTDATIYEPSPDFKFKNDTSRHVLINAYIKGDEAIFEFWGTNDGRETTFKGSTEVSNVDQLKPRVYNVVSPPAMKLVETLDLAPGQKKCTEVAHAGADAEFTYIVTHANGSSTQETFTSHYRPWQAVCLIGVEKLTAPPDTTTDESAVN